MHIRRLFPLTCLLLLIGMGACHHPSKPSAEVEDDTMVEIVADMALPHEARPHGVPETYNWAVRPRVGMGNNPGAFRALIAWGQLYEAAEGNPATNTRVHLRDLRTYVLSRRTGTWRLLQSSTGVEGHAYVEDFLNDVNRPADIRPEQDGGVSVMAGGGYNFHFWPPSGRVAINPADIGGLITSIRARLITADSSRPDDRNRARYVLGMGADYWLDLEADWNQFKTNGDAGIGRFKYVRPEWRTFYMTTLSEAELRQNPPPFAP